MKQFKLISLITLCLAMLTLSGCYGVGNYQKSIYNDDSKIVKEADSFNYFIQRRNVKENNANIKFERFYGMETIWTIEAEDEENVSIDYQTDVKEGDFKVVLITPDNVVNVVVENSNTGSKEIVVKKGNSRIKIVGNEAKGEVSLKINLDKQMNLKYKGN